MADHRPSPVHLSILLRRLRLHAILSEKDVQSRQFHYWDDIRAVPFLGLQMELAAEQCAHHAMVDSVRVLVAITLDKERSDRFDRNWS
jgi:hypothetical protein